MPGFDFPTKPQISRGATFEGPRSLQRDDSPASLPRLSRVPTETSVMSGRSQIRSAKRDTGGDVFGDPGALDEEDYYDDRSASPAPSSYASNSRAASWAVTQELNSANTSRKMPPPPPPSRSKKPPPPPPLKRSALSTSEVPFA